MTSPNAGWVADLSFDSAALTGPLLKSLGCVGVIGYAGCADAGKNVSKPTFQGWLAAGLSVSLVIENGATDMSNPANGAPMGRAILAAAQALGYDVASCVLWVSADFNVPPGSKTLASVDACMAAFSSVVPVAGLYGNSYAIDYSWQSGSATHWWQSDSTAFSDGVSAHAHLIQRYNDPRAKGQPVDVNDVLRTPLAFMSVTPSTGDDDVLPEYIENTDTGAVMVHYGAGVCKPAATTTWGTWNAMGRPVTQMPGNRWADYIADLQLAGSNHVAAIASAVALALPGTAAAPTLAQITAAVQAVVSGDLASLHETTTTTSTFTEGASS